MTTVNSEHIRMVEAVLFAAEEPLGAASIAERLPQDVEVEMVLEMVRAKYELAGFHLVKRDKKYAFRSAPDLANVLQKHTVQQRRLSKAALETLAIISYHQPVTRAEIEDIRGVSVSKGTLDVLLESEWVRMRGRRRVPGRPVTYGTSQEFLDHFGLESLKELPGLDELKAVGLLDDRLPPGFNVPDPDPDNDPEEDPLNADGEFLDPLETDSLEAEQPSDEDMTA